MIHKISELCNKINGLKRMSDDLYNLKYNNPKTPERDAQVQHMVDDIQATCRLIGNDIRPYDREHIDLVSNQYDPNGLPIDFTDKYHS